jgi:hypothetical protein
MKTIPMNTARVIKRSDTQWLPQAGRKATSRRIIKQTVNACISVMVKTEVQLLKEKFISTVYVKGK